MLVLDAAADIPNCCQQIHRAVVLLLLLPLLVTHPSDRPQRLVARDTQGLSDQLQLTLQQRAWDVDTRGVLTQVWCVLV